MSDTETVIAIPDRLLAWGLESECRWDFTWASEVLDAICALTPGLFLPSALPTADAGGDSRPHDEPGPPRGLEEPAETAGGGAEQEPRARRVPLTLVGEPEAVRASERLLARLEALVYQAVRAKRVDLLVELDFWTAEAFKLRFTFGELTLGTGEDVGLTYDEGRAIVSAGMRWSEITTVMSIRDALRASSGKDMRLGGGDLPRECDRCGSTDARMGVEFDDGTRYCWDCYAEVQAKLADRRVKRPADQPVPEQLKVGL